MLCQRSFDHFFATAEVRLFQPFDDMWKVDSMPLGGEVQDSKGAGDLDPLADGGGGTSALVDENEICLELDAERNGGAGGAEGSESSLATSK